MLVKYLLKCWNPYRKRYEKYGEYSTLERAEIMFNKPYFKTRTRRLEKVSTDVLYMEKANANSNIV